MAADYAEIDLATLMRWLADERPKFREFRDAVKLAQAKGDIASLATIQTAAQSGQWQASAWLLERRHPAEYGRRQIEVRGADGGPIQLAAQVIVVPAMQLSADAWSQQVQADATVVLPDVLPED